MSKEERIEMKLGMIYEQLFNINWKLEKIDKIVNLVNLTIKG
jgi:hypothetical protein